MLCADKGRTGREVGCQEVVVLGLLAHAESSGLAGWLDLTCGGDEARTLLLRGRLIRRLGRFRRAKLLQREAVCYMYLVKAFKPSVAAMLVRLPPSSRDRVPHSGGSRLCDVVGHTTDKLTTSHERMMIH